MEHLNWLCKTAIEGLGAANKSEKAIMRVGKTVGVLEGLLNNFDSDNDVATISNAHTARSMVKDLNIVIKELQELQAFKPMSNKVHRSFKSLSTNLIRTLNEKTLKEWMVKNMAKLLY